MPPLILSHSTYEVPPPPPVHRFQLQGQTSAGKAGKAAPGSATRDCRGDEDETPSRLTTLPGNPRSQPPTTQPTPTEMPSKAPRGKGTLFQDSALATILRPLPAPPRHPPAPQTQSRDGSFRKFLRYVTTLYHTHRLTLTWAP